MEIDLDTIPQSEYEIAEDIIIGYLLESYPDLDIRRGTALRELLVRPMAGRHAVDTRRIEKLIQSRSLSDLLAANPDTDTVNAVLSKFRTRLYEQRLPIVYASLKLSKLGTVSIPAGSVLTGASGRYRVLDTFTYTSGGEDELFTGPGASGNYTSVPIQLEMLDAFDADVAGEALRLPAGMVINNLVSLTVNGYMDTGRQAETVQQAYSRIPQTLAARGHQSRLSIQAALTGPDAEYKDIIQAASVVGYGDGLVTRARNTPFGVPDGSVDVYVRTFEAVPRISKELPCTYEGSSAAVYIPADLVPGFYDVSAVREPSGTMEGSYPFVLTPGFTESTAHNMRSAEDAARSSYQSAELHVVRGVETGPGTLEVEFTYAPSIADIQAYMDDEERAGLNTDIVVRMPVVAETHVDIAVLSVADAPALRQAITDYINQVSFVERLDVAGIYDVCHEAGVRMATQPAVEPLSAVLRGYDRTPVLIHGSVLDINPVCASTNGISPRSVVFSTRPENITIRVGGKPLEQ